MNALSLLITVVFAVVLQSQGGQEFSVLTVHVINGTNLPGEDPVGLPDLFVRVTATDIDGVMFTMDTTVQTTRNPIWNEHLNFGRRRWSFFTVQVFDDDVLFNDPSTGEFAFSDLNTNIQPKRRVTRCVPSGATCTGMLVFAYLNIIENGTNVGGDPHFSIILPDSKKLCYTIQGECGSVFNLISSEELYINALFVPNAGERNATWIGSLGVVIRNGQFNVTTLKFDGTNKQIFIGDGITLDAKSVQDLYLYNGNKLSMSTVREKKHSGKPSVRVSLDVGIHFTVKFTQKHLDAYWHKLGGYANDSHGLIGQFYRSGVEIDEDKRILAFPNKNPIPVKQRRVWGFMKQEVADGELCWAAMNLGEQGEGIIDGSYLDYRVKDLLFSDFNKFKPKKHPN